MIHTLTLPTNPPHRYLFGQWRDVVSVSVVRNGDKPVFVTLLDDLEWVDPDSTTYVVPRGFTSDGASLPPATWWLLGGKLALEWLRSAILHDHACQRREKAGVPASWLASERFYRGLRADQMPYWRARLAFHGVDKFGPQWGHSENG